MKTPWMQTKYRQLNAEDYLVTTVDTAKMEISLRNSETKYTLSEQEYFQYMNNELDYLKMENMYYRGLALDDEGKKLKTT